MSKLFSLLKFLLFHWNFLQLSAHHELNLSYFQNVDRVSPVSKFISHEITDQPLCVSLRPRVRLGILDLHVYFFSVLECFLFRSFIADF